MTEYVTVPSDRVGLELDEYLALLFPGMNKGFLRREVNEGRVRLDGMAWALLVALGWSLIQWLPAPSGIVEAMGSPSSAAAATSASSSPSDRASAS